MAGNNTPARILDVLQGDLERASEAKIANLDAKLKKLKKQIEDAHTHNAPIDQLKRVGSGYIALGILSVAVEWVLLKAPLFGLIFVLTPFIWLTLTLYHCLSYPFYFLCAGHRSGAPEYKSLLCVEPKNLSRRHQGLFSLPLPVCSPGTCDPLKNNDPGRQRLVFIMPPAFEEYRFAASFLVSVAFSTFVCLF